MYNAIIAEIHTRTFPGADRLLLGDVLGFQVIVGKETQDGELGVYFPVDGQLSPDFCEVHKLIGTTENYVENGVTKQRRIGGFFEEKRRVKALKLRGQKSDGFWMPLSCLKFTGVDLNKLTKGYEFTEVNGVKICDKYYTKATRSQMKQQAKTRKNNPMFPQHVDTSQFAYRKQDIPLKSLITITAKLHGTSHRIAHALEEVPISRLSSLWNSFIYRIHQKQTADDLLWKPSKWNKFLSRFIVRPNKKQWIEIHGTRKVQLKDVNDPDGFYGVSFRGKATNKLHGRLRRGEVIYLEIVGWASEELSLMTPHDLNKLPELLQKYQTPMYYSYGCLPGENRIYIYRITQNDEDGHVTELSWRQVQKRAEELGVPAVPEYCQFIYGHEGMETLEHLEFLVHELAENHPDPIDSRHIREGVVIRIDSPEGNTYFLKDKSWAFKFLEGILKEDDNYVDVEEIQSDLDDDHESLS